MRLTRQASLAIALSCGFLAALGAYFWIVRQKKPVQVSPPTIEVPVPVRAIPAQTELRPGMFHAIAFDKAKLPSDVVTSAQVLQGRVSVVELPVDLPVKAGDVELKTRMGLAFGVPRGYRAMSVALDLVGMVGEFIKPGNRVDVLASFEEENKVVVRTVVQDALVLTVGQQTGVEKAEAGTGDAAGTEDKRQGGSSSSTAARGATTPVSLALTPTQAQVVLASDMAGKLRLVLRATGDGGVVPLPAANSWSLTGPFPKDAKGTEAAKDADAQPTQAPVVVNTGGPNAWGGPPAPPQRPRRPSVEVIRGGERELVTPE